MGEPRKYDPNDPADPYEKFIDHTKWVKAQDEDLNPVDITEELAPVQSKYRMNGADWTFIGVVIAIILFGVTYWLVVP